MGPPISEARAIVARAESSGPECTRACSICSRSARTRRGASANRCRTLGVAGEGRSGAVTVPADFSPDGAFSLGCPLLPRHRDAQALLGGDQVVGVLGVLAEVDLDPVDRAGEDAALAVVVVADGGCGVASDVGGLVR